MSFSWTMAAGNIMAVVIAAVIAYVERRFNHAQLGKPSIPFINHGGNWADLICVTLVIGLIMPTSQRWGANLSYCLLIAAWISVAMHAVWGLLQTIPGHIIEPAGEFEGAVFWKLPVGGLYHAAYMTIVLGLILAFYLYPGNIPNNARLWVSIVLTIFIILAIIQPGWYSAKVVDGMGRIDLAGWITAIALWGLIWVVGYCRISFKTDL